MGKSSRRKSLPPDEAAPAPRKKPIDQLLPRGIGCALIGLAVLLSPDYIRSESVRELVRGAYLVGWFGVVLGLALVATHFVRQAQQRGRDGR